MVGIGPFMKICAIVEGGDCSHRHRFAFSKVPCPFSKFNKNMENI
jgi:hypothetical protein